MDDDRNKVEETIEPQQGDDVSFEAYTFTGMSKAEFVCKFNGVFILHVRGTNNYFPVNAINPKEPLE